MPGRPRSSTSGEGTTPLRSFWIAAFDGTDHFASADEAAYRRRVEADYRRVSEAGIGSVHESVGWRRAERDGRFDFTSALIRAESARRAGLQVVWMLCDARWPDDVDVGADDFPIRLRRFAAAAARALAPYADVDAPVYAPIDEISFLSWALAETSLFGGALRDRKQGRDSIRRRLVRGALAACDAILEIEPRARFMHREAALHASPAATSRNGQFDAWDMIAGRLAPELGGHPRYLDIVAIHCHWTQQWRAPTLADAVPCSPRAGDPALVRLLADAHARYRRPLVVFETNRIASGRAQWLRAFAEGIGSALERGIPVVAAGLCRVVERPAWEDPRYWRGRRLWDVLLDPGAATPRAPDSAYEQALRDVRARIDPLVDHLHPGSSS